MNATLYFNQRTNGGTVLWEKWELVKGDDIKVVYGDYYSLKEREVIIPEGYSIGKDFAGETKLYDADDLEVRINGDYHTAPYIYEGIAGKKRFLKKATK